METIKCVVIGDGAVGKTTLLIARTYKCFSQDYVPTVLDNFATIVDVGSRPLGIGLWDTAGQEDYDKIRQQAYTMRNNPDVALVLFSVVSPSSFENLRTKWIPEIKRLCPACPLILIGTKADLREDAATLQKLKDTHKAPITHENAVKFAKKHDCVTYIEISSVTQKNVDELFREVARTHLNRRRGKRPGKICWDNTCMKELGITTKKHKCYKCRLNFCNEHAEVAPDVGKDKKYICKKCSGQALLPNPEQTPEEKEKFEATERAEQEKAAKALEAQKKAAEDAAGKPAAAVAVSTGDAMPKWEHDGSSSSSSSAKSGSALKKPAAAGSDADKKDDKEEKKEAPAAAAVAAASTEKRDEKKEEPKKEEANGEVSKDVKADAKPEEKVEKRESSTGVAPASPMPTKADDDESGSDKSWSRSGSVSEPGSEYDRKPGELPDEGKIVQEPHHLVVPPPAAESKPSEVADEKKDEKEAKTEENGAAAKPAAESKANDETPLPAAPLPSTSSSSSADKPKKPSDSTRKDSSRRRDSSHKRESSGHRDRDDRDRRHKSSSGSGGGSSSGARRTHSSGLTSSPKTSSSSSSARHRDSPHSSSSARKAEGSGSRSTTKRRSDAKPSDPTSPTTT